MHRTVPSFFLVDFSRRSDKVGKKSEICISAGDLSLRSYRSKDSIVLEKNRYHIMHIF